MVLGTTKVQADSSHRLSTKLFFMLNHDIEQKRSGL